ncbi:hypothetical protein PanWU01x14_163280 [Parasponia andersonii]|uniref:Uncharacterized protein n=1 Tax=Parasponia andersonii TaxID=3476 RepID=A0A2P5CCM8_PARAD|nr:hypothetical protein PanWU01x14_163280 [Parasponia andersonii]
MQLLQILCGIYNLVVTLLHTPIREREVLNSSILQLCIFISFYITKEYIKIYLFSNIKIYLVFLYTFLTFQKYFSFPKIHFHSYIQSFTFKILNTSSLFLKKKKTLLSPLNISV